MRSFRRSPSWRGVTNRLFSGSNRVNSVISIPKRFKKKLGWKSLAAVVGMTGLVAYEYTNSRRIKSKVNVKLTTYPQMIKHKEAMRRDYKVLAAEVREQNKFMDLYFEALVEGIENDDLDDVQESIDGMLLIGGYIPLDVQRDLIVMAANYHNVHILEYFAQEAVFGAKEVLRNDTARMLLRMPTELREKFHYFMQQYYQSPGKIDLDGAAAYVKVAQEYALQELLKDCEVLPEFTGDFDLDILAALQAAEEQKQKEAAVRKHVATIAKHTYITDGTNYAEEDDNKYIAEVELPLIYENVKADVLRTGEVITPVVFIGGAHYTFITAEVMLDGEKSTKANVIFIDSLSSGTSMEGAGNYYHYRAAPYHVFEGGVNTLIAEDKLQRAAVGCSLFVMRNYEDFILFDRIFSANKQYEYAGAVRSFFRYAMDHITHTGVFGYDVLEGNVEQDEFKHIDKFSFFVLPILVSTAKQSLTKKEPETFIESEFVELEDGRGYRRLDDVKETEDVLVEGRLGLDVVREMTSEDRKQEFKSPRDLSGQTVDEFLDDNTLRSKEGKHKPQNKTNDYEAYRMGNRAGQFFAQNPEVLATFGIYGDDKPRGFMSKFH